MPKQLHPARPWLTIGAEVFMVKANRVWRVKVKRFTQDWVIVQSGLVEARFRLKDLYLVGNHSAWTQVPHLVDPASPWAQASWWRQRFEGRLAKAKKLIDAVDAVGAKPEYLAEQLREVQAAVTYAALWLNEHPDAEKED